MSSSSSSVFLGTLAALTLLGTMGACTANLGSDEGSGGGGPGSGGAATGGANIGGVFASGGASSGGVSSGGAAAGGASSGGASAGGGPGSGGADGYPATFETIRKIVRGEVGLAAACGSVSCHHGEATPHFYDGDELHQLLTDPSQISEYCGNIPLVTPGDPSKSAILMAMRGQCEVIEYMPNGCDPDPLYGNCLPLDAVAAVEAWILAGALEQ